MGEKSKRQSGQSSQQAESGIDTETAGKDTRTTTTGTGRTGTGRTGTATGKKSTTKDRGLSTLAPKDVPVTIPGQEEKKDEPPKRKRGRPKGSTNKAKAQTVKKADITQVKVILATISGIIASRAGMEVWALTDEEMTQLAEPIANILAKSEALKNATSEHADALALLVAAFTIFIPKYLLWNATRPKKPKKGEQKNYDGKPRAIRNETGTTRTGDKPSHRPITSNGETTSQKFGGQLFSLVEPVDGFGH